jgi:hypothetical protein
MAELFLARQEHWNPFAEADIQGGIIVDITHVERKTGFTLQRPQLRDHLVAEMAVPAGQEREARRFNRH